MLSVPVDVLNIVSADLSFETLINLRLTHTYMQQVQEVLFAKLDHFGKELVPIIPRILVKELILKINCGLYEEYVNLKYNKGFNYSTGWTRLLFLAYKENSVDIVKNILNRETCRQEIDAEYANVVLYFRDKIATEVLSEYIEDKTKYMSYLCNQNFLLRFKLLNIDTHVKMGNTITTTPGSAILLSKIFEYPCVVFNGKSTNKIAHQVTQFLENFTNFTLVFRSNKILIAEMRTIKENFHTNLYILPTAIKFDDILKQGGLLYTNYNEDPQIRSEESILHISPCTSSENIFDCHVDLPRFSKYHAHDLRSILLNSDFYDNLVNIVKFWKTKQFAWQVY